MGRSLTRFSLLAGSAIAAGSLMAGCAASVAGPAVIAAPAAVQAAPPSTGGDFLAGLEQAVANELSSINTTQSDNEPPEVLVELNALDSEGSLIQAETFGSLITTGANQIAKREHMVSALISDVKGSTYLSGVEVNGTSVANAILAVLNGVDDQLQSQAGSIESASVVDELRSVITSIGPSTRVFGLVEPSVHLAIAAGEELNAANILKTQWTHLSSAVSHAQGSPNYSSEIRYLNDLANIIATVSSATSADVNTVLALTPAGYPGNKATILNVRAQLVQFRSSLGQLNAGSGDVNEIQLLLSEN